MTKLDQFKQEKKQLEYELGGRVFTAKLNAMVMLDAMAALKKTDGTESEQIKGFLTAVFGSKQASDLLAELNMEGINSIVEEVVHGLGLKTEGK